MTCRLRGSANCRALRRLSHRTCSFEPSSLATPRKKTERTAAIEGSPIPTILIIGASRGIGLETVRTALNAGYKVRALARSANVIAIDGPQLEVIVGDALDLATIKRALAGVDAVVQALGVRLKWETVLSGTTLFSRATRVLVDEMQDIGVKRLVVVTGLGAGDSRGGRSFMHTYLVFPLVLQRIYDDKGVQEEIIASSNLDWTIVRPGILTNGPATDRYHALIDAKSWRGGFISRRDVADYLVRQIADRSCIGKAPVLIR